MTPCTGTVHLRPDPFGSAPICPVRPRAPCVARSAQGGDPLDSRPMKEPYPPSVPTGPPIPGVSANRPAGPTACGGPASGFAAPSAKTPPPAAIRPAPSGATRPRFFRAHPGFRPTSSVPAHNSCHCRASPSLRPPVRCASSGPCLTTGAHDTAWPDRPLAIRPDRLYPHPIDQSAGWVLWPPGRPATRRDAMTRLTLPPPPLTA